MKTVSEELNIWLAKEPTIKDGYTYEDEVLKMTLRIGRQILSKSQGDITSFPRVLNCFPCSFKDDAIHDFWKCHGHGI